MKHDDSEKEQLNKHNSEKESTEQMSNLKNEILKQDKSQKEHLNKRQLFKDDIRKRNILQREIDT